MELKRTLLGLLIGGGLLLWTLPASATCSCACVDGQARPICSNSFDVPVVCPQTVCPLTMAPVVQQPPSAVIQPVLPGSQQTCADRQVYNSQTGQSEWRRLCE
jgi:hypothetical protein